MSLDIHPEYQRHERKPRLTILSLVGWLCAVGLLIGILVMLPGCAVEEKHAPLANFHGLCALKVIGQDEHGNIVART